MVHLIIASIILIFGYFLFKSDIIKTASYDSDKNVLSVKYNYGKIIDYHLSNNIWHEMPDMSICSYTKHEELFRVYTYIIFWKKSYVKL